MRNFICNSLRWLIEKLNQLIEKVDTGVPIQFIEVEDEGPLEITDEKVWIIVLARNKKVTVNVSVGSYPNVVRQIIKTKAKAHQTSIHSLKQFREMAQAQVIQEIK